MHVVGVSGLDQTVDFKKAHFPGLSSREYRIAQGFDSAAAPSGSRAPNRTCNLPASGAPSVQGIQLVEETG
jgi:hypothetical protein